MRLYILDTNVLIQDPRALFRFQEHDVYIPIKVLEELDKLKQGESEVARNVREVSRLLDELVADNDIEGIRTGIALPGTEAMHSGHLFIQTDSQQAKTPFEDHSADNTILAVAKAQQENSKHQQVVLVSSDINLRIKARAIGLIAENYHSDQVVNDLTLLPVGTLEVNGELLKDARSQHRFSIDAQEFTDVYPGLGLFSGDFDELDCLVHDSTDQSINVTTVTDYRQQGGQRVWGIQARNREQNFAFNQLMDPDIDLVTLLGIAGTGKTLLALAAGLEQTLEQHRYQEIIVTRATVPVGDDIGFLPGTEEEKMTPWMGALMDNLEVLAKTEDGGSWGQAASNDLIHTKIKLRSLSFMRGRTFLKRYLIIDEAQNLTRAQVKTLLTRAGPGTKIVCMGNIAQIDTPYITPTTSGLTYLVERFKQWPHSGHVTLARGERSRLADYASKVL
jgi:PhoH-like ATPase